jgi:glycosyltransferase involved in cell wall biosynthesis
MKILELGKFYPPHHGGIETLLRFWCEGFVQCGAEVDCVVANDAPRTVHEKVNGVRVHRFASYGLALSTSLCPKYVSCARRYGADIWHVHFPNPLADIASICGPKTTPLVLSYHSDVIRQAALMNLYRPVLERLLKRATSIVVATPRHIDHSPWLTAHRKKCEVIPYGIDLARFLATPASSPLVDQARERAAGRPILLTVGRLVEYKGQRYLIEALRELEAVLWIVGTGPLEDELRRQAIALGVQERVQFWGGVTDQLLPGILHACDVFVLPSITPNEAFGVAQVEAMICEKPVVSCALRSGVPYVNLDGLTGLVVPPMDASALAASLQQLLSQPKLRSQFGQAGRKRAKQEFEVGVMIRRYWKHFAGLLGNCTA